MSIKILKTFTSGTVSFIEKCKPMNGHGTRNVTIYIGEKILDQKKLMDESWRKFNFEKRKLGGYDRFSGGLYSAPRPVEYFANKVEIAGGLLIISFNKGQKYHILSSQEGFTYSEHSDETFVALTDEDIQEKIEMEKQAIKRRLEKDDGNKKIKKGGILSLFGWTGRD